METIKNRIEYYNKENSRLFYLIIDNHSKTLRDLIMKTINENELIIKELNCILKLKENENNQ